MAAAVELGEVREAVAAPGEPYAVVSEVGTVGLVANGEPPLFANEFAAGACVRCSATNVGLLWARGELLEVLGALGAPGVVGVTPATLMSIAGPPSAFMRRIVRTPQNVRNKIPTNASPSFFSKLILPPP